MALLTVAGLHASYGDVPALRGVSLEVGEGEIVALLGSNGAGKTTTLRSISGLMRPRSGSITFAGTDITRRRAHAIVAMGLNQVPEGRRIFPALSVEENINLGGYLSRRDRALVAQRKQQVFDLFPRLAERRRQLGGTLSGGEQQMLAIGRALMNEPRLLALDEPSMGLAPVMVRAVGEVIRRIRAQGTAILMVEQNVRQALVLADRAYVLETGRIVIDGPASELAQDARVQHAYLGGSAEEAAPSP
ncbi:MAG: ABC transporter ATP-binding protein [Actinobacteria bacterium]|nr:ABC transporter ATP-binding protein [Actinomycetota bacterium]MBO0788653.1 ABC transporter ATP-binding protein [Actinomycetota bacterium]